MKGKKPTRASIIHRLLTTKINNLYYRAINGNQPPSKSEIEEIENLEKLEHFVKDKKIAWEPFVFPVLVLLIAGVVGYLIYIPKSPIGVVMQVTVPDVKSRLKKTTDSDDLPFLASALAINGARINNLENIELSYDANPSGNIIMNDTNHSSFVISFFKSNRNQPKVSPFKPGYFLHLYHSAIPDSSFLEIRQFETNVFEISVTKFIKKRKTIGDLYLDSIINRVYRENYQIYGSRNLHIELGGDRNVLLHTGDFSVPSYNFMQNKADVQILYDLDSVRAFLTPEQNTTYSTISFSLNPQVGKQVFLQYFTCDDLRAGKLINKGVIKFAAIEGREYKFEKGEYFFLEGAKGAVTNLSLDSAGISFEFSGTIEGAKGGRENLQKELMPSKMDYILANRGNKLFYEITLAIIGLIYSAYLWFKSHK